MPHKAFIADDAPEPTEPTTFDLGGTHRIEKDDDGNPKRWVETFTCIPVAPAGVLDDLASASTVDSNGNRVYNARSLVSFFEGVLIDEDVERFRAIVRDKNRIVPLAQMGDVMIWLAEELTGRPTQR